MSESPEDFHRRTGMQGGDFAAVHGKVFQLEILLGNAAMQSSADVADALRRVAEQLGHASIPLGGYIFDANGNSVGGYQVDDRA